MTLSSNKSDKPAKVRRRTTSSITLRELILVYEGLKAKGKIKPNGAAVQRLEHLKNLRDLYGERFRT
jgi:hypothetical protein